MGKEVYTPFLKIPPFSQSDKAPPFFVTTTKPTDKTNNDRLSSYQQKVIIILNQKKWQDSKIGQKKHGLKQFLFKQNIRMFVFFLLVLKLKF